MSQVPARPQRVRTDRTRTLRSAAGIAVQLTPAGDLGAISAPGSRLVNQYPVGPHDVAPAGLHLRRTVDGVVEHVALTGSRSGARFRVLGEDRARWDGSGLGVSWTVHLVLDPARTAFVWRVELRPEPGAAGSWDVAATQDLALAPAQMAQTSEAYVSQYVAHRLAQHAALGTVVLSRQTMAVAPELPLFVFAIAEGAAGAGTDGFDLYTPAARDGSTPAFLSGAPWPDRVRQHEMAMAGLLSHPVRAAGPVTLHVVGVYQPDLRGAMDAVLPGLPGVVAGLVALSDAAAARTPDMPSAAPEGDQRSLLATAPLLRGARLPDLELLDLAAGERYVEHDDDGAVLSFFSDDGAHVVRGEKDTRLVRPHGHVLIAGDALGPDRPVLSTTVFAHGVVGSHTVLGNTSFDRFTSVHRNHLNLLRSNGVRVLLRRNGAWAVLGRPSAFVLDVGEARWLYRIDGLDVTVRTVADPARTALLTEVTSSAPVDLLVTSDLDLGDGGWYADERDGTLVFRADDGTAPAQHHAGLAYALAVSAGGTVAGDGPLYRDGVARGSSVVTVHAPATTSLRLVVAADLDAGTVAAPLAREVVAAGLETVAAARAHRALLAGLTRDLRIADGSRLAELEVLAPWWAHDARVHYLVPHGLEQYSGAAWGTRDVCQGPFELLLAAGRFASCRDIVLRVLAVQSVAGTFPQWFMFDDYREILQDHAHGDIVHWPLFALGQYLRATGDLTVLDAAVPFRDGTPATVVEHLDALLSHLETDQVPGTALPSYGDGDWDDTLQPARPEMRAHMASTWTTALAYQTLELAVAQLDGVPAVAGLVARMSALATAMVRDLRRYMLPGGVSAGFVTVTDGVATPVIHPDDTSTGLTYRLMPMTQLVLAGVLDQEQAHRHEAIVREHLHFPDGVRLADRPTRFADGEVESFLRAEQAAFFGREVGLMYAHAHIRWSEALGALGRGDVGAELLRLSPIGMGTRVPSALRRQRTCYTSSSDAVFPDRYTAARDFDRLRSGEVPTADGWRVYSSGPGIYLHQVMHSLLGLEERADALVVGPTLSAEDDGLEVTLVLAGRTRRVRYQVDPTAEQVQVRLDGAPAPATPVSHPYRWPSARVDLRALEGVAVIDVRTPAGS